MDDQQHMMCAMRLQLTLWPHQGSGMLHMYTGCMAGCLVSAATGAAATREDPQHILSHSSGLHCARPTKMHAIGCRLQEGVSRAKSDAEPVSMLPENMQGAIVCQIEAINAFQHGAD